MVGTSMSSRCLNLTSRFVTYGYCLVIKNSFWQLRNKLMENTSLADGSMGYTSRHIQPCSHYSPLRCFSYIVMACNGLYFGEQMSRFRLKYRYFIGRTSKCFYGIQRIEQVHGDKLTFILIVVPKNITADIPCYCLKPRVNDFAQ